MQRHTIAIIAFTLAISGCLGDDGTMEASPNLTASLDEHARDDDGGPGEAGEESGTEYALHDTYDQVRNGARLVLTYDAQANAFKGTVENTTRETLSRVRVEVHLSNGRELGPTTPAELEPGESRAVTLTATSTGFDGWTAHPEVGSGEDGGGEHGGDEGEHGGGEGEHDGGQGEHGEGDERDGGEHGGDGRRERAEEHKD